MISALKSSFLVIVMPDRVRVQYDWNFESGILVESNCEINTAEVIGCASLQPTHTRMRILRTACA
jgi:hypothetical protein